MGRFSAGDEVTCLARGRGEVFAVAVLGPYPVEVEFVGRAISTYTTGGRLVESGNVTLFKGNVKVTVTPVITKRVGVLPTGEWCEVNNITEVPKMINLTENQFKYAQYSGSSLWQRLWQNAEDPDKFDAIIGG